MDSTVIATLITTVGLIINTVIGVLNNKKTDKI